MTWSRRDFLKHAAAFLAAPAILQREAARPQMPCGVATGDVASGRAIVWSRTDRPARMILEYSTTSSFREVRRIVGPAALEDTDFTARASRVGRTDECGVAPVRWRPARRRTPRRHVRSA